MHLIQEEKKKQIVYMGSKFPASPSTAWAYQFPPRRPRQYRRKSNWFTDYSWRPGYISRLIRACLAEFLGTLVTIFFGAAAVASIQGQASSLSTGSALASLFVDFVAISTFSPISGAFFNPAVVLGFWLLRRVDGVGFLMLFIAQILGSFTAAVFLVVLLGGTSSGIGAPVLGVILGSKITWWSAFILEMFLAAAYFLVILYNYNLNFSPYPALAIGSFSGAIELAIRSVISIGPNPMRWLGPAVISGIFDDWWVWLFPPFMGVALIGVPVFLIDTWLRNIQLAAQRRHARRLRKQQQQKKSVVKNHFM